MWDKMEKPPVREGDRTRDQPRGNQTRSRGSLVGDGLSLVSFGGSFGGSSRDGFDFASWGSRRLVPFVIVETFARSEVRSSAGVVTFAQIAWGISAGRAYFSQGRISRGPLWVGVAAVGEIPVGAEIVRYEFTSFLFVGDPPDLVGSVAIVTCALTSSKSASRAPCIILSIGMRARKISL